MKFVDALDTILKLAIPLRKLLGYLIDATRHIPIGG